MVAFHFTKFHKYTLHHNFQRKEAESEPGNGDVAAIQAAGSAKWWSSAEPNAKPEDKLRGPLSSPQKHPANATHSNHKLPITQRPRDTESGALCCCFTS
ncbi:hypothetical protein SLE2022_364710 [Rubroshorea leprosula]